MDKTSNEFVTKARRVSTPLLAIGTLDQFATAEAVTSGLPDGTPAVAWDHLRGFVGANPAGQRAAKAWVAEVGDEVTGPEKALHAAARLPVVQGLGAVLLLMNFHRFLSDVAVVQGLANIRDQYKRDKRTAVMLGPSFDLPAEVGQDVAVYDEPLPSDEVYAGIAVKLVTELNAARTEAKKSKVSMPASAALAGIVAAVRGLAAFPAEQALALCLTVDGYDLAELWRVKKRTVETNQGLRFEYATGVSMEDVIGLDAIAAWGRRLAAGPRRPGAIMFMDEIEKMVAGSTGGDTSGVSQALQGSFLTWSQERRHKGILLVGPPGVGKSYVAEAMANTMGIPVVKVNFGDVKSEFVGASERNMRALLKTVDSIAGRNLLMVATCNREEILAPELRDRFNLGTWYVDPPSPEAQAAMWRWYVARPEYAGYAFGEPPAERHFTGRDVANIVDSAWAQQVSLVEAARTSNVPVCVSQQKAIEALRERAHGVFLSAHRPGPYYRPGSDEALKENLQGRAVTLADEGDGKEER